MNALVFDRSSDARNLWKMVLDEVGVFVEFGESITNEVLKPRAKPRILVFDQTIIGSSLESIAELCRRAASDVTVFTGDEISVASAVRLMKFGASWVFQKGAELNHQQIREAVPLIQESALKLADQISEFYRLQKLLSTISPREHSVLEKVLEGVSNKEIAKELEVSVRTVESRRAKIYRKCEVSNITELVRCVDRAHQLQGRYGECFRELRTAIDSGK